MVSIAVGVLILSVILWVRWSLLSGPEEQELDVSIVYMHDSSEDIEDVNNYTDWGGNGDWIPHYDGEYTPAQTNNWGRAPLSEREREG